MYKNERSGSPPQSPADVPGGARNRYGPSVRSLSKGKSRAQLSPCDADEWVYIVVTHVDGDEASLEAMIITMTTTILILVW